MSKAPAFDASTIPLDEPHAYAHLATWRERAGLTQEQVANIFNVSNVTIHRWEVGKSPVTVQNFLLLSRLYGASDPGQLMFAPSERESAEALRRAHRIISSLPARQAGNWLSHGEDLADAIRNRDGTGGRD